jgi:hypothetical protein
MIRFVVPFAALAAALFVSLPAHATGTLTRTFVSSTGSDSNPCTTAAPCATFTRAYSQVTANGIVAAIDPGKYGSLTITSSVTIDGNGWASITAPSGGSGILIQAGTNDNVILRGITIDGAAASANNGIEFDSGKSLTVTGSTVRNIGNSGDGLDAFDAGTSPMTLTVSDSAFINNNGAGLFVGCRPSASGTLNVSVTRTEISGNSDDGILAESVSQNATVDVTVTDSVLANNGADGVNAGIQANMALTAVQIIGNGKGIYAFEGTVWLAQSTVAGNTVSYDLEAGTLNSYGDNYFANNGNPTNGSLTPVSKQ